MNDSDKEFLEREAKFEEEAEAKIKRDDLSRRAKCLVFDEEWFFDLIRKFSDLEPGTDLSNINYSWESGAFKMKATNPKWEKVKPYFVLPEQELKWKPPLDSLFGLQESESSHEVKN